MKGSGLDLEISTVFPFTVKIMQVQKWKFIFLFAMNHKKTNLFVKKTTYFSQKVKK